MKKYNRIGGIDNGWICEIIRLGSDKYIAKLFVNEIAYEYFEEMKYTTLKKTIRQEHGIYLPNKTDIAYEASFVGKWYILVGVKDNKYFTNNRLDIYRKGFITSFENYFNDNIFQAACSAFVEIDKEHVKNEIANG